MKLIRFGPAGHERPGVLLDDTKILDVRAMAFDIEDYNAHFFATRGLERVAALLRERNRKVIPAEGLRLGPPVARPGKLICLGKNYADHAAEFDAEVPDSPILFSKAVTSLIGPADPIILPRETRRADVEVELAVVIGRRTRRVSEAEAPACIAGYTILDDVTDRDAQKAGKQWFRGKSADTFGPMGPWLVTPDEVGDPHQLRLYSKIAGRTLQDSSTADMIFKIPFLLSFISAAITLEPGDVLATGTPGGIGSAHKPPVLLNAGDTVELGIDKLGRQANPVAVEA